jgi:hypothetical protein
MWDRLGPPLQCELDVDHVGQHVTRSLPALCNLFELQAMERAIQELGAATRHPAALRARALLCEALAADKAAR